jgi:hypothetical protein
MHHEFFFYINLRLLVIDFVMYCILAALQPLSVAAALAYSK